MTRSSFGRCVFSLAALVITTVTAGAQAKFASPEEAAAALLAAIETGDCNRFLSVAGSQMAAFWSSDNPIRDSIERDRLIDAAHARGITITGTPNRKELYIGAMAEPFPAPLVKTGEEWNFDGNAGAAEVTARRIRGNETAIVELCSRIREAEFSYFQGAHEGAPSFAGKIRSAPGERDGLYWTGSEGEESPLGPVFAAAAYHERLPGAQPRPLFGYFFRIVSNPHPKRSDGRFALVAWPAEYGVGGVRSFLTTQSGEIFVRDLGRDSARAAANIAGTRPDPSWTRLEAAAPEIARSRK